MGNIFKTEPIKNHDLYKSLIESDIIQKLNYLENKIDELDAKIWALESKTQANIKVLSKDIHTIHHKILSA